MKSLLTKLFFTDIFHFSSHISGTGTFPQMFCLLNGSLNIRIDDKLTTMNKEDAIFISGGKAIDMTANNVALILVIVFNPCFLFEQLGFSWENISCTLSDDNMFLRHPLISHMAALTFAYYNPNGVHRNDVLSKAYALLNYIELNFMPTSSRPVLTESNKHYETLLKMQKYLEENYAKALSLPDFADYFGYTAPYMSSYFKKSFGMTFGEYLTDLRLKASELYMSYSDETPAKIAALCGFPNLSALNTSLQKKHGLSPEQYISIYRKYDFGSFIGSYTSVTSKALILDYLSDYIRNPLPEVSASLNTDTRKIAINAKNTSALKLNWNEMINLGSASDFERPIFRKHISQMQSELSFKYGRFIGLFFLAKSYNLNAEKVYDFSRLFQITDFLKSIHLLPMIELSNKPFHIYNEDEWAVNDYETFLNPVIYDRMLLEILPPFLKASVNRYGIDEVSKWRFELWMRYNPAMTSTEPYLEYLNRYNAIAGIIKSILPSAKVGGPGFNTFLDSAQVSPLLEKWHEQNFKPDFFSVYYFPYLPKNPNNEHIPTGYEIASSPARMSQKLKEISRLMYNHLLMDVPLCVTEYNAFFSQSNSINDSIYPALFILYQTLTACSYADYCGYWLASDLSLEYKNPSAPFFGGNGIISKHGIPKPAYYVHTFLKQLGNRLISKDENYIVTLSDNGCYMIMAYDVANLRPDFSALSTNTNAHQYTYSSFENTRQLKLEFTLANIKSGNYILKEMHLNQNHGNALNVWRQFNYMTNLKPEDIRYIRHQCLPFITSYSVTIDSSFTKSMILNSNQIVIYLLTPEY